MFPRVIINADDFGWTKSINEAVAEAYDAGTVTSASLMAGGPWFAPAVELAQTRSQLGIGLHFNLTQGRPLTQARLVPSLCDGEGRFFSRATLLNRLVLGKVRPDDIKLELNTQLSLLTAAGLFLTHLDGHQHVHVLPVVMETVIAVAKEAQLALRMPVEELLWQNERGRGPAALAQLFKKLTFLPWAARGRYLARRQGLAINNHFRSPFGLVPPVRHINLQSYRRLFRRLKPGVTEIMVHPALAEDTGDLWGHSQRLMTDRLAEAAILTRPELTAHLEARGIVLVNYSHVRSSF